MKKQLLNKIAIRPDKKASSLALIAFLILSTCAFAQTWTELGPNTKLKTPSDGAWMGQGGVTCVAFYPNPVDSMKLLIGGMGGIWKSTDGASTWSLLHTDQQLATTAVSDIVIDPNNINNIYVATGQNFTNQTITVPGLVGSRGVYRSTDGGTTYTQIASGFPTGLYFIHALLLYDSNTIFAATSQGIYKTSNATSASPLWSLMGSVTTSFQNIIKDSNPSNSTTLYASGWDIYKSTDAGSTWTSMTGTGTGIDVTAAPFTTTSYYFNSVGERRFTIGIAPSSPYTLYANSVFSDATVMDWSSYTQQLLFKYNGTSWTNLGARPRTGGEPVDQYNHQYRWSRALTNIAVSPIDPNTVYLAASQLVKYNGSTFSIVTTYNSQDFHPDIKKLIFSPFHNNLLFLCTDGYLCKYDRATSTMKTSITNNGLGNSTLYGLSFDRIDENMVMIGTQDNGTSIYKNNGLGTYQWSSVMDGDGFLNLIQPGNIAYFNVSQKPYRTTDWAATSTSYTLLYVDDGQYWQTPIKLDPIDHSILYYSARNLWKYPNYGISSQTPGIGSKLSDFGTNFGIGPWQVLDKYDIAPSNNKVIYAEFAADPANSLRTRLFKTTIGGGTGATDWSEITSFPQPTSPSPSINLTGIVVSPYNPNTIFVSYLGTNSSYRVKKFDGTTWSDYNNSAGLPTDIEIYSIVYENGSNDGIYIGTDIGIYYTNATMTSWIPYMSGFPNAVVTDLQIAPKNSILYAGTWGRGVWKGSLYCPQSADITLPGAPGVVNNFYETTGKITSTTPATGPRTTYRAGISIVLNPGFNAVGTAETFTGIIHNCTIGAPNNLRVASESNTEQFLTTQPGTEPSSDPVEILSVYPVPNNGSFTVKINELETEETVKSLIILDMEGRVVKELDPSLLEQKVELENSNFYILKMITNKRILQKKLFVEKTEEMPGVIPIEMD